MKKFVTVGSVGDGVSAAFGVPGFVAYASGYYAFIQSGLQLRLTKSVSSNTVYAIIFVDNGVDTEEMKVSINYGLVAYADITELARVLVARRIPTAGDILDGSTAGGVEIRLYDSGDSLLGVTKFDHVNFVDGLAAGYDKLSAQYFVAPDRLRLPRSLDYVDYRIMTVRAAAGVTDANVVLGTMNGAGETEGTATVPNSGEPVMIGLRAATRYIVAGTARTAVDLVDCLSDKVLVKWWSNFVGGYKCWLCDIVSPLLTVIGRNTYNNGFEYGDTVDASQGFALRFPQLSVADWLYCRDILSSGDVRTVEIERAVTVDYVERRAVVRGDAGLWKAGEVKDFDIDCLIDYTTAL